MTDAERIRQELAAERAQEGREIDEYEQTELAEKRDVAGGLPPVPHRPLRSGKALDDAAGAALYGHPLNEPAGESIAPPRTSISNHDYFELEAILGIQAAKALYGSLPRTED
jgi:hypothetical protein